MRIAKGTVRARLWQILEERAPASGARLPPERVLKSLVGCSRETLRAALSAFEAEGEVWRHVEQGTFRGRMPLDRPFKDTLLLEATTPADLMVARRLLEPQVAAAAAARNPLLIALLRQFSSARCRAVWQTEWDRTYRRVGVEEFTRVHGDHHEQVVDAIAASDGTAAHRAMAHHLEAVSIGMGVLNHMPSS